MAKAYSPVGKGYDPRKDAAKEGSWLSIKDGDAVDVTVLVEKDDILYYEQCAIWLADGESPVWVYTGPGDPADDLGIDKRYRACLPVLVEGEPKVWSMGKQTHAQILEIAEAGGNLAGAVLRIKRTGQLLKTRYSIIPRGKREDISKVKEIDVIAMLDLKEAEEIREMLTKRFGKDTYDAFSASYKARKAKKGKVDSADLEEITDEDLQLV